MNQQDFIGLIIESSFGEREVLYVSSQKGNYSWEYSYSDPQKHGNEIFKKQGDVEKEFYIATQKVLMNFKIQPYLKFGTTGLDGVNYTLILGDSLVESRFKWRHKLPEEWSAFVPILDDIYRNLQIARKELHGS